MLISLNKIIIENADKNIVLNNIKLFKFNFLKNVITISKEISKSPFSDKTNKQ